MNICRHHDYKALLLTGCDFNKIEIYKQTYRGTDDLNVYKKAVDRKCMIVNSSDAKYDLSMLCEKGN